MPNEQSVAERNRRIQERWDELCREGTHGHYETLFRIVREETELLSADRDAQKARADKAEAEVQAQIMTVSIIRGEYCAVAQNDNTRNGCGICPSCAKLAQDRVDELEVAVSHLTTCLHEALPSGEENDAIAACAAIAGESSKIGSDCRNITHKWLARIAAPKYTLFASDKHTYTLSREEFAQMAEDLAIVDDITVKVYTKDTQESFGYFYRDDKVYLKNGVPHREDGPACEYADGTKEWYQKGLLHREDGPAIERVDGRKEWYLHGHPVTQDEFNNRSKNYDR